MKKISEFILDIWHRLDWRPNIYSWLEFILLISIAPAMYYANPQWFVEDGLVENIQLAVLIIAFLIAIKSRNNHQLFAFVGLMIIFMIMRETNLFRGYFCAKYLSADDMCRWSEFKYGYLATGGRIVFALFALWYFIKHKLWQLLWKYIVKAPIFVWEFLAIGLTIVGGTIAEFAFIDNEIMEECCELICYLAITNCIWRYCRVTI